MDWQPIETAPTNGIFLLAVACDGERRVMVAEASNELAGLRWMVTQGWTGWSPLHSAWTPTRWMPLPPPPNQVKE